MSLSIVRRLRSVLPMLLIFLTAQTSQASKFSLWSVDQLSMDYFKYRSGMSDSYFTECNSVPGTGREDLLGNRECTRMQFQDGAALNLDLEVLRYAFWRNRFHMSQDQYRHVKHVGWEWEVGLDVSRMTDRVIPLELFQHHHSRHGLEYINPRGDHFPVVDTYGVRLKFIERSK